MEAPRWLEVAGKVYRCLKGILYCRHLREARGITKLFGGCSGGARGTVEARWIDEDTGTGLQKLFRRDSSTQTFLPVQRRQADFAVYGALATGMRKSAPSSSGVSNAVLRRFEEESSRDPERERRMDVQGNRRAV